ncbi:unnamed protein product [Coffea canephora]|uniref:Uncharacterized protein n=1 Tax=Coffea canephora TaxID=49390 RepID=A0A068UHA6_COFCA|nr:unnamed protein product [Coffea canephora]
MSPKPSQIKGKLLEDKEIMAINKIGAMALLFCVTTWAVGGSINTYSG